MRPPRHVQANPAAGLDRPVVDYDTSATPGLARNQAIGLLEATDGDAGPQAARTAALVAGLEQQRNGQWR